MSSAINSISDQSAIYYYKSFVNFINIQSKTYADRVFVRYYSNNTFKTLTYSEVDRITTNLACEWAEKKSGFEVVSYINDHNVDYMITMFALMKLRIIFLAISPRNSEPAIINLLEKTQSKVIFATPKYESIAQSAAAKIDGAKLTVIQPLDIEAMLNQPLNPRYKETLDFNFTEKDIDQPALIIHRYIFYVCVIMQN
jgi:long-subunit acyl-CoA synthetase (AMP-forming)